MKQNTLTSRAAIIGLGNVLLGDDAFGSLTVEILNSEYECDPQVEISDLGTPGLDLAPYLYGKDLVVIVDAVNAEGKPGTLCTYTPDDFLHSGAQLRLTDHDVGVAESLAQMQLADCAPSEVIVVGVIPESCEFGEGISSTVFAACSVAAEYVAQLLRERGFACQKRSDPVKAELWWSRERHDNASAKSG